MKLKEIKPDMVIHCKTEEEKQALLQELERLGYFWYSYRKKPTEDMGVKVGDVICVYDDYAGKNITHWDNLSGVTHEFSDLVIPETDPKLSVEEALHIFGAICCNVGCSRCPFDSIKGDSDCTTFLLEHNKEAAEICAEWKSYNEKKAPEIETVDICRIIEIQSDGSKRCVHEADLARGSTDSEIKILVEEELKNYCMEHDGEFIAVHEVVSRVKAVE